jgi:hypothetical protein
LARASVEKTMLYHDLHVRYSVVLHKFQELSEGMKGESIAQPWEMEIIMYQ